MICAGTVRMMRMYAEERGLGVLQPAGWGLWCKHAVQLDRRSIYVQLCAIWLSSFAWPRVPADTYYMSPDEPHVRIPSMIKVGHMKQQLCLEARGPMRTFNQSRWPCLGDVSLRAHLLPPSLFAPSLWPVVQPLSCACVDACTTAHEM